jgi:hypothetical protein
MLDSRPGQVLNLPAPSNPEELAQQKRIFDKVWSEVEKVVDDFKFKLLTRLATCTDGSKPVDEIEKTIELSDLLRDALMDTCQASALCIRVFEWENSTSLTWHLLLA